MPYSMHSCYNCHAVVAAALLCTNNTKGKQLKQASSSVADANNHMCVCCSLRLLGVPSQEAQTLSEHEAAYLLNWLYRGLLCHSLLVS